MTALQLVQQQERSLDSYVILPESSRRGQEYPALLVSQDKDHFSKNWYQAHRSLAKEGSFMLNPRQFFDFVLALDSGKRIYNGNGKLVDSSIKTRILDEIMAKKEPWKGEWLDAYFVEKEGKLYIQSSHTKLADGRLVPMTSEPLEKCLMTNCYTDLRNINRQGLPIKESKKHEIYFWHPANGRVSWFGVNSVRAGLVCDRDARYSGAGLGVRPSKIFHKQ